MLKLTGNEKAVLGGLASALAATIVQLQQSGQLTAHELLLSLATYIVTHIAVWLTTNTAPAPQPPVSQ